MRTWGTWFVGGALLACLVSACGGRTSDTTTTEMGGAAGQPPVAGAGGSGGQPPVGGAAGSVAAGQAGSSRFPSCAGLSPGADLSCGKDRDLDCCATDELPGGSFVRFNDTQWPAVVSPFRLDRLEVTVGRFRAFVQAYDGFRPSPGQGSLPGQPTTGWNQDWEQKPGAYSPTAVALRQNLLCPPEAGPNDSSKATWTDEPGTNEYLPITCLTRHEALAFCLWDGGRLPTVAEYSFAASGGEEQRPYPWGTEADPSRSVNQSTPQGWRVPVGSRPLGRARWGQLDLAGSRFEFQLDSCLPLEGKPGCQGPSEPLPLPCQDCVRLSPEARAWGSEDLSFYQTLIPLTRWGQLTDDQRSEAAGVRCARER